ncbi:uncharacterized protein LOC128891914 [Hylaeus anthracinus]|uniref:uncharacterized protein LOC128891914 n=1 Tax=Hylaeus anthracinus TaxID=313031 RepID=UPI0023B8DCCA|nr:uncharacterized protein LOC128891914 [Hylaeus anthracinus]
MNSFKRNKSKNTLKTNKSDLIGEKKKSARRLLTKSHETEEEAVIRRFHDAQRMARFRAKKKKALEEEKVLETLSFNKLSVIAKLQRRNITFETTNSIVRVSNTEQFQPCLPMQRASIVVHTSYGQDNYSQLSAIIEELGKDVRLAYAGSKTSAERLKVGILRARMLIKECLSETEINLQR